MSYIDRLIKTLNNQKKYERSSKLPLQVYQEYFCGKNETKGCDTLKILLLCNPCNGFGDVVFAMKLKNYLVEEFGCDVKIASTKVDNFKTLGESDKNLYKLGGGKSDQCRRFRLLYFTDEKGKEIEAPKADLIFVAPLQMDFEIDYSDVKGLVNYSTYFNTFFFSEYNDSLKKGFDFNTGVGKERDGLLFTNTEKDIPKIEGLNGKYAVVYIAQGVAKSETCFIRFLEMLCEIYSKLSKFQIVVPEWIAKDFFSKDGYLGKKTIRIVQNYFDKVVVKTKNEDEKVLYSDEEGKHENTLVFRGDILPLPYKSMTALFTHSVREILVTGDQSITDVLSCCWKDKLPMYQIVPWKRDFSKELAKHLPQKFLKFIHTSCGSAKAINYHPDFKKFMKSWDFRTLAKPKLEAILSYTYDVKKDKIFKEINEIFLHSRGIESIISKLEEIED